ncbi:AfsR family transcriptional regulator [Streptomyces yokosukanensis]|uniref:AfsR family transcriptional regulator n=1 Tax=Streptomyces yokosukanensis TaxID=67386 RepID=A0A101PFC8_9ACTN|nr:BTAD domain-containing putative transcriptional regulator [Streptomyces yokosukanensis]KUN10485.1 AfsR family transcriptional regulator [Streptomyces yokosukanensis]
MTGPVARTVRFNILGSLEIQDGEDRLRLGGPIQERVLVALLLEPGRVVPVSRLIEVVWEQEPPATAVHQIRKAVADLRRRIPDGADLIVTDSSGYRACVEEEQLDLSRFTRLTAQARQDLAAGAVTEAADHLRAALALWRGPVLADRGGGPALTAVTTALDERRITAAEQLFQLRLDQGETADLIGDLRELITAHPLHETLRAQLMLALYRSGRAAEALEEYGRVRDLLIEELGTDPGPRLTKLYEAILHDSDELTAPEPRGAPAGVAPPTALSTLPYDLTDFTGREDELKLLLARVDESCEGTRIVAVDGMGGCGKTSLAVHAGHLLADRYPDGRLHVDLRGHSPGEEPLQPAAVLGMLLRTIGVPDQRVPEDEGGRAALWRATLTNRRVLLLLDNASDTAQVRPLLPASPGCLVLITSRQRLVHLDGAEWISLGEMPPADSATLLAETLGEQRVAAEPEAVTELAELCGHLPLALRITSARLRNRSRWTVQHLVDRLRDETRRLGELSAGERSVAATIQLSYQAMDEPHRKAFRLLGLHPGTEADVHSGAALLGTGPLEAEDILERLLDVHLVRQNTLGRYALHDLVRSVAQSLRTEATRAADHAAVQRVVDYYVAASEVACSVLFPGRAGHTTQTPSVAELPPLHGIEQAGDWFCQEQEAVLSAVAVAHERGLDTKTGQLARNAMFYLNLRGCYDEYAHVAELAVASARRLGEGSGLRTSLTNLTSAHWKLGRFRDGLRSAEEAHQIALSSGDLYGEAVSLDQLGLLNSSLGQLREGREQLLRSVEMQENPLRKGIALCNLSTVCSCLGRYEEAVDAAERAVVLHSSNGEPAGRIPALNDLAVALLSLGDPERAKTHLDQALAFGDGSSVPEDFALTLALAADAEQRLGHQRTSAAYAERAVDQARTRGTALRACEVENIVGRVHRHGGAYARALELHRSAAQRAGAIECRVELARAHDGVAQAAGALGDQASARRNRSAANELFAAMGMPCGTP